MDLTGYENQQVETEAIAIALFTGSSMIVRHSLLSIWLAYLLHSAEHIAFSSSFCSVLPLVLMLLVVVMNAVLLTL